MFVPHPKGLYATGNNDTPVIISRAHILRSGSILSNSLLRLFTCSVTAAVKSSCRNAIFAIFYSAFHNSSGFTSDA